MYIYIYIQLFINSTVLWIYRYEPQNKDLINKNNSPAKPMTLIFKGLVGVAAILLAVVVSCTCTCRGRFVNPHNNEGAEIQLAIQASTMP